MLTFTANDEEYRLPFSHSNKISEGMTVTVAYNPEKIESYLNSFFILEDVPNAIKMGIICIVSGFIAMLVGFGAYIGLYPEIRYFFGIELE